MKTNYIFLLIQCLFMNVLFASAGNVIKDNGKIVTDSRKLSAYTSVVNKGSLDVVLLSGTAGNVRVEASENIQEYIITEVRGETLFVSLKENNSYHIKHKAVIFVEVDTNLKELFLEGSGDIEWKENLSVAENFSCKLLGSGEIDGNFKSNKVSLLVKGSGDMDLGIQAMEMVAKLEGSGAISLEGACHKAEIVLIGSGDIDAKKMNISESKMSLKGSGDIEVFVTDKVVASVIGSGDILILGSPKDKQIEINGSGAIRIK